MSIVVFVLSFRLAPIPRQCGITVGVGGVVLSAVAIALILFGVDNLQKWGLLVATDTAPFSVLRLSPAPLLILLGIVAGQALFAWSYRRVAAQRQPLLAMEVTDSDEQRSAVVAFPRGGQPRPRGRVPHPALRPDRAGSHALGPGGGDPALRGGDRGGGRPVRLYDRFSPRRLGIASFVLIALGLVLVALTVGNDWGPGEGGGGDQRGRPAPAGAGIVPEHRRRLTAGDLLRGQAAQYARGELSAEDVVSEAERS
jgi:hypothetical protein